MSAAPRIGVVGVGTLGARHAQALALLAHAEPALLSFAGVFDLRPERAAQAAKAHGGAAFASLDALLGSVDGVVIATPTVGHEAAALQALAAGKGVLVEKPIADGVAAGQAIVRAAEGRPLFVGHSERFNPAVRAAKAYATRPRHIEARRLAGFSPRATDVDVVLDLMIHDIDLVLALTGERPSRVQAIGVAVLTESEDLANAWLEFPSGTVATLTASRVSPERLRKLRVFSDHAYLSLDLLSGRAEAAFTDRERLARAAQVYAQHAAHAAGATLAPPAAMPEWTDLLERRVLEVPDPGAQPLALELGAFARALSGGGAPAGRFNLATGADGLAALEVAEDVRRAMRERARRWPS
jgi:predicted dehydrogenase